MNIEQQDELIVRMCAAQDKMRPRLYYECGGEEEEVIASAHLSVIACIRAGKTPDFPEAYALGILRYEVSGWIHGKIHHRTAFPPTDKPEMSASSKPGPLTQLISKERQSQLTAALANCNSIDRDILKRFYIEDQSKELICREMDLTPTQFRLLKSRAKLRLTAAFNLKTIRCKEIRYLLGLGEDVFVKPSPHHSN